MSIELLCKSLKISSNIALKVYYMEEDVLHFEDIFNNAKLVKKYKCSDLCNKETPSDICKLNELKEAINCLLKKANLTDIELKIIKLKYGFDGCEPLTTHEISTKLNYSTTWISRLEISAMQKIWNSEDVEKLFIYSKNYNKAYQLINYYREFYSNPKNQKKSYKKIINS